MAKTLRIVQWTTGNVARQTLRAVLAHPEQELVGVFAHSPDKVGQDAGELVGLDPIGVTATDDVDALLALEPDCVVYTPLHPDLDELTRLLGAGVNVVTSSEFLTGNSLGQPFRDGVEAAAQAGGASIFGSGMNPGFAQLLAGVCAGVCVRLNHVRVTEAVDTSLFAGDSNMAGSGPLRPEAVPSTRRPGGTVVQFWANPDPGDGDRDLSFKDPLATDRRHRGDGHRPATRRARTRRRS